MSDEFFKEMKEEIYSDNLPSEYNEPFNLKDICVFEDFSCVCKNNNVTCTDGSKKYYVDGISYTDDEGFVLHLVETE